MTGELQHKRGADSIIDLGLGHPSLDLLPASLLLEAAEAALADGNPVPLQYGAERGGRTFRHRLAAFIAEQDGADVHPDALFVTSGASVALDLLCGLLTRPGDLVLTTEPTYHLALKVFADHGLEVVGIASDSSGPDLDQLEDLLKGRRPALLYLVPYFANPSGFVLAPERRERLVALARESDFWLISDEVYRLLAFEGRPPQTLVPRSFVSPDRSGSKAISINSFSKILAPGLRLGWVEGPEEVLHELEFSGLLQSGGGLNPFTSALVSELLANGQLETHLRDLRRTYARRSQALCTGLREHLPEARFEEPTGGYFTWLELPGWDSAGTLDRANELGVNYHPGNRFTTGADLSPFCRLSFAHYSPGELDEAARRLSQAVESRTPSTPPDSSSHSSSPRRK